MVQDWPPGAGITQYLGQALGNPTSSLVVSGERILASEFPASMAARRVLDTIGGRGERTFSAISARAGMGPGSLAASLQALIDKRVVAVDVPLSTRSGSRDKRYRVADPFLGFWLTFVEPALAEVERARPDLAMRRVNAGFPAWRGRAVEPVVREALGRLPLEEFPDVGAVSGWWPRSNSPEIDLVGGDQAPVASVIEFVGSIKWRTEAPFDGDDVRRLARDAIAVPGVGAGVPLVAVSRTGSSVAGLRRLFTPADLLSAYGCA